MSVYEKKKKKKKKKVNLATPQFRMEGSELHVKPLSRQQPTMSTQLHLRGMSVAITEILGLFFFLHDEEPPVSRRIRTFIRLIAYAEIRFLSLISENVTSESKSSVHCVSNRLVLISAVSESQHLRILIGLRE